MKAMKKVWSCLLAVAVVLGSLALPATAKADTTKPQVPFSADGVFLGTYVSDYANAITTDSKSMKIDEEKVVRKYVNKFRMEMPYGESFSYDDGTVEETAYKAYGTAYMNVYTKDSTTELIGVKTNSKNLKAIVSHSYKYQDGTNDPYYNGSISLKAKKAGKYKVTATFRLKDGRQVKATCPVLVVSKPPVFWELPTDKAAYTNVVNSGLTFKANKVKVKAKAGKNISRLKLYYLENDYTSSNVRTSIYDGNDWKESDEYKISRKCHKIKNGGTVKLPSKSSYKAVHTYQSISKNMLSGYTSTYSNTDTTTYNNFYPSVTVYCFYKDRYYGIQSYDTLTLYKYKKH